MFDECVAPLVEGLFQGYNATVLAYGQVRSATTLPFPSIILLPCAIDAAKELKKLGPPRWGLKPAAQHVVLPLERNSNSLPIFPLPAVCAMMMGRVRQPRMNPQFLIILGANRIDEI